MDSDDMAMKRRHNGSQGSNASVLGNLFCSVLPRVVSRAEATSTRIKRNLVQATLRAMGAGHAAAIPTWTTQAELHALYRLACAVPPGSIVLEIGSYLGASTCYLAAGLCSKSARLYCVDTWNNETMPEGCMDTFAQFQQNTAPFDNIVPVRRRSEDLEDDDVPSPVRLAFIDGDHSAVAVARDFEVVTQRIGIDGIVAFHDVGIPEFPAVSELLGRVLMQREWRLEGVVESLVWIRRVAA